MNKFSVGHLADCGGRAMDVYDAEEVDARIAELEAELQEQARLHGMGSEREAKQLTRIAELENHIAELERSHHARID